MSSLMSRIALLLSLLSAGGVILLSVGLSQDANTINYLNLNMNKFNSLRYFDYGGVSVLVPLDWTESNSNLTTFTFTSFNNPSEKEVISIFDMTKGENVQSYAPTAIDLFHVSSNGLSEWFTALRKKQQFPSYDFTSVKMVGMTKIHPSFAIGGTVEVFAPSNNESRTSQIINSFRLVTAK